MQAHEAAAGVPVNEATAKDFIMVRAALVRRLGGANEALVWSRIEYRASSAKHAHETPDGSLWWAASRAAIAEDVGLTSDQVRRAIETLVQGGFLRAERHHGADRTMSYSPVFAHGADLPDGNSDEAHTPHASGELHILHEAYTPDAPSIETVKTKAITPIVPTGTIEIAFDRVWDLWPSVRRGTRKKSFPSFQTAVKAHGGIRTVDDLLQVIEQHCAVWSTWPAADLRFVPAMTTWLNQERWTAEPPESRQVKPSTVERGRAADEILKQREAEREGRRRPELRAVGS